MIKRAATFTNTEDNVSLVVDSKCPGILIERIDGIYAFDGDVRTSPYTNTHGDRYKSSRATKRNIVVYGKIFDNFWDNRQLMYRLFRIGATGRFTYSEPDREDRYVDYYVESVDIDQDPFRGQYQISLICPDPFFYDDSTRYVDLNGWMSGFEFAHEFNSQGEEFGYLDTAMSKVVANLNGVDDIGLKIVLTSTGSVVNPYLYMYETGEQLTIGTANKPYTVTSGKPVEIETGTGKKDITEINGSTRTRINEYLDPDSTFFQLHAGVNTIGFNADSGADYLSVHIEYRMRYLGV